MLAWIGLGADGLSSSAYGPEEAFKALDSSRYLALPLALAVAGTVALISACYVRIIERYPSGGGAYLVTSRAFGGLTGLVAAVALVVDYALTIAVSIAAAADALLSLLPGLAPFKTLFALAAIAFLVLLNIRGLRESVTVLAPIFVLFVLTHAALIALGIARHAGHAPAVLAEAHGAAIRDLSSIGLLGIAMLLARAFAMGAGTFTGIEAVSNGMSAIREPRTANGKRTMRYMAVSLAATAAGLLVCYLLADLHPEPGRTFNAVLAERAFGTGPVPHVAVVATLAAEAAILVVAAQTGFIGGPRVMANMAVDSWLPHRFAALSERLTTHYGILCMGGAAAAILWYAAGDTHVLVVMYSINVFIGFALSQAGMLREIRREKVDRGGRRRATTLHTTGLIVCAGILVIMVIEKFAVGGWLTLGVTGGLFVLCVIIHGHYSRAAALMHGLDQDLADLALTGPGHTARKLDPRRPTAVLLVGGFSGFGVHSLMSVIRHFPGHFENLIFVSVAVIDSGSFKGADAVGALRSRTEGALQRYVDLANRLGFPATYEMRSGTDVVDEAETLCRGIAERFPRAVFFTGKLIFRHEAWFHRLLHNETGHAIQRRLQWAGLPMLVLPIRERRALAAGRPPRQDAEP